MIRDHFKAVLGDGKLIEEVRLIRNPATGKIKGFAYVQLKERKLGIIFLLLTLLISQIHHREAAPFEVRWANPHSRAVSVSQARTHPRLYSSCEQSQLQSLYGRGAQRSL